MREMAFMRVSQEKRTANKYLAGVVLLVFSLLLTGCQIPPVSTQPDTNPGQVAQERMVHTIDIKDERMFLIEMIPHHQEAVDTSQLIATGTTDPELKSFTTKVIADQTAEITQMKNWLQAWFKEEYAVSNNYAPMMPDLAQYEQREREKLYVEGMIFHHKGAIKMAEQVIALNPRPDLKRLAEAIIAAQTQEVSLLEGWLSSKYADVKVKDTVEHIVH